MSEHALDAVHAAAPSRGRPSWAGAAWRQFRLERRMFWRNPTAAFFGVLLPLVLLALFGAVFSGTQENLDVVVPGIAGLSVASACFVALAYNLTWLRERGILKRVRGTPLSASAYLAGIAANAVANTVLQVGVVIVAGRLLFGVPWPGDWLALLVFLVLGVVCFASLGVALSHVIPNSESAPAFVNAIFLPMMFVAGVFYDEENAPAFLKRHRRGHPAQAPHRRALRRHGARRGAGRPRRGAARAGAVGGGGRGARRARLLVGSPARLMARLNTAMWASLGLIAWTHAGYPLAAAAAASRRRYEPRRDPAHLPSVALIIAAHDEERVIAARLENALALDYPRLEIIVSLDGSTDGTREIVERFPGVRLLVNERGGKVAAQNAAVRATDADVLAFSDANSMWEPDALRRLVAVLADPEVGYVCGRLRLVGTSGENLEGHVLALRAVAARAGVAARVDHRRQRRHLRRAPVGVRGAPLHVEPRHRPAVPAAPGRAARGVRARAVAVEPAAATTSDEWARKVRMLSRSWGDLLLGGMLDPRRQPPGYFAELLSHRLLRYSSGLLHVALLGCCLVLAPVSRLGAGAAGCPRRRARPSRWRGGEACRSPAFAWYYVVVTAASVAGLARMLRDGPQATWTPVEGTR